MFEPEELMARIVDLEAQLKESEMAPPAAEQLISCLEGEIAKRDERIVEIELEVALRDQALDRHVEYGKELRAELAAIKAQDTVGEVVGWYRLDRPYEMTSYPSVCATWHRLGAPVAPLYAAPVSEAKAQGVVMPPSPYMPGSQPTDFTDYELGEIHGRIAMWEEVKRLNAAPVQKVSDDELLEVACHHGNGNKARRRAEAIAAQARLGSAILNADGYVRAPVEPTEDMVFAGCAALVGSIGGYEAGLVERCYDAMLAAALAAPVADAGLVEALGYQVLFDAIAAATSVYANGAVNISVQAFRESLAAHRATGVQSAKS